MGSIRFIIFAVIIWLVWRMVVNFLAENKAKPEKKEEITKIKMVMCSYCNVHLPEDTALPHNDQWFCNQEHKQLALNNSEHKED